MKKNTKNSGFFPHIITLPFKFILHDFYSVLVCAEPFLNAWKNQMWILIVATTTTQSHPPILCQSIWGRENGQEAGGLRADISVLGVLVARKVRCLQGFRHCSLWTGMEQKFSVFSPFPSAPHACRRCLSARQVRPGDTAAGGALWIGHLGTDNHRSGFGTDTQ